MDASAVLAEKDRYLGSLYDWYRVRRACLSIFIDKGRDTNNFMATVLSHAASLVLLFAFIL